MWFTALYIVGNVYIFTAFIEWLNLSQKTKDLLIAGTSFVLFAMLTDLFY